MFASAKDIRRDIANLLKPPRRMKVSEAVAEYMRVPVGGGNSVKWDKDTAAYMLDPMDCLNSREYDAVIFVGPARTGKTIGLIDGWMRLFAIRLIFSWCNLHKRKPVSIVVNV